MSVFVSVSELKERADALVAQVAAGGEHVVVTDGERRLAILTPHGGPFTDRAITKAELGFDPAAGLVGTPGGREFLGRELREAGIPVADSEGILDQVYSGVLTLCEDKEVIFREDIRALAEEVLSDAPGRLRLLALTIQTTTGMPATAEVTLQLESGPAMRRQQGDGPLDAAFKAIEKLTGIARLWSRSRPSRPRPAATRWPRRWSSSPWTRGWSPAAAPRPTPSPPACTPTCTPSTS